MPMKWNNVQSRMSLLAISLVAAGLSACSGKTDSTGSCQAPSAQCPESMLDIQTSLAVGGADYASFSRLVEMMRARIPDIHIRTPDPEFPSPPGDPLKSRLANANPPDVAQFFLGPDLREWVRTPRSVLAPLETVVQSEDFANNVPRAVFGAGSVDGHLYAVPLSVERDNTLFFNRSVLERAQQKPPTTLDEVFRVAEHLKAQNIVPLAVAAKAGWTVSSMLFEGIFVAHAGPDFYTRYFSGGATADAPEMVATLETFARMLDYSSEARGTMSWTDAAQELCAGKAAMLFMPNFVAAEFKQRCANVDIDYVPVQGNEPVFVFVAVGFSVLAEAPHPFAAREFIKLVASMEGQAAFNPGRFSIPARTDVPMELFAEGSLASYADYVAAGHAAVPAYALIAGSAFQEIVNPALQKFVDPIAAEHKNVERVLAALRQGYATLSMR